MFFRLRPVDLKSRCYVLVDWRILDNELEWREMWGYYVQKKAQVDEKHSKALAAMKKKGKDKEPVQHRVSILLKSRSSVTAPTTVSNIYMILV
jgi:hypothetical protein